MALFALIILAVWFLFARWVALKLIDLRKGKSAKFKVNLLSCIIAVLPLSEEIYIFASFQAHCFLYSGIVKLEPVHANALRIDGGWSAGHVLEHPLVQYVELTTNTNMAIGGPNVWVSKTADQSKCSNPINEAFLNSPYSSARELPLAVAQSGYCYFNEVPAVEPKYVLGSQRGIKHSSFSTLFPYEVNEDTYSVSKAGANLGEHLSIYSVLHSKPGRLFFAFFEHSSTRTCPGRTFSSGVSFPFENEKYVFLSKAISGGLN